MKTHLTILAKTASILASAALILPSGCKKKDEAPQVMPPVNVETATVVKKDVPFFVDSFGQLESILTVDIMPQISGKLMTAEFIEGAAVTKGQLLFTIETNAFAAAYDKAVAALEGDEVNLKLKKETLDRNRKLADQQLIAQQDFDTYQSAFDAAAAQVKADRAALESASIDLAYCRIAASFDGLTGKRLMDPGNIVEDNKTKLVNLRSLDPLFIDFAVSEDYFDDIHRAMKEGAQPVYAVIAPKGDEANVHTGRVEFIDNAVDEKTGTIALRGTVPNPEHTLWPGQFINVRLFVRVEAGVLVVPPNAVQIGKMGPYVFVLDAAQKAELRPVAEGLRGDDWVMLTSGVKEGETVVTMGQLGLRPGAATKVIGQTEAGQK